MDTRNVSVTLEKAREWYNSGNATLKEVALQAFKEEELKPSFKDIKTFHDACDALGINYESAFYMADNINKYSRASAAMFQLNIIRKALNLGQDLHLTKDPKSSFVYYPYNPFITTDSPFYKSEVKSGNMEIIGKIKSEGTVYYVLGGSARDGGRAGLGYFRSYYGVGYAVANVGFLGCASKEIAQHLSKHFGMLIIKAEYGDMVDFKIM
jgi:hypothetical protein